MSSVAMLPVALKEYRTLRLNAIVAPTNIRVISNVPSHNDIEQDINGIDCALAIWANPAARNNCIRVSMLFSSSARVERYQSSREEFDAVLYALLSTSAGRGFCAAVSHDLDSGDAPALVLGR
jgi:hypothetical protein